MNQFIRSAEHQGHCLVFPSFIPMPGHDWLLLPLELLMVCGRGIPLSLNFRPLLKTGSLELQQEKCSREETHLLTDSIFKQTF